MEIKLFYPGFVRKALTFTIDDGNVEMDEKFISIVKPCGIKGTFNLCTHSTDKMSKEEYRKFYSGFEIANHCKYHPHAFTDGKEYSFSDKPFDPEDKSSEDLFLCPGFDRMYYKWNGKYWCKVATDDFYVECARDCHRELEEIFGKGSVRSYVWPFCEQKNEKVKTEIKNLDLGYYGVRKTGEVLDTTGYALPSDWNAWSYNCTDKNLLEQAAKYEAYADDGELKFFAFGLHSIDYERNNTWGDLKEFAERYGNRPSDYWYASVCQIYDYVRAAGSVYVGDDGKLHNPSDIPVYVEYNGEKIILEAN